MLTASELEFFACEERILINPRVRLAELKFTCEAIDELQPLREVEVPLWLALFLKKRDKCQIKPPEWLEVDRLKATLAEARENEDKFSDLPFHYLEMAKLLLANVNNKGPFLPPWVPVVCVAPVCPQGITCSRPRKV